MSIFPRIAKKNKKIKKKKRKEKKRKKIMPEYF